jgi:hypothetical protein
MMAVEAVLLSGRLLLTAWATSTAQNAFADALNMLTVRRYPYQCGTAWTTSTNCLCPHSWAICLWTMRKICRLSTLMSMCECSGLN